MAEERLIDDDKDRKYKIRKNADGEEELVIDDLPQNELSEAEETEEVEFEVPELLEDDEEAAVMTPEQLAARDRAREESEAKRVADLAEHIAFAKKLVAEEKFEDCAFVLDEAVELAPENGETYALKLIALTQNFKDTAERVDEALQAADAFCRFASDEVKSDYANLKVEAEKLKAPLSAEVEKLNTENEEAKGARRELFKKKRKTWGIAFACTGIPFVVFAVLAVYFSTVMHAVKDGTNMILFFVFLGIAVVALIATLFTAHKFWDGAKLLSLNERNSSSKLGREYELKNSQLKLVEKIISAFGTAENTESV